MIFHVEHFIKAGRAKGTGPVSTDESKGIVYDFEWRNDQTLLLLIVNWFFQISVLWLLGATEMLHAYHELKICNYTRFRRGKRQISLKWIFFFFLLCMKMFFFQNWSCG